MVKKWNNAGAFASTKQGPRRYLKYTIDRPAKARGPYEVTFTYPNKPPTVEQRQALMRTPCVACSACSPDEQRNNQCHAVWLTDALKVEFNLDAGPEVISSALADWKIPGELSRKEGTADWHWCKRHHEWAYIAKRAVLLMRKGHPRGIPKLIPGMTSGASIFGNPFTSVPIPLNRALYHRYMAKGFEPLNQAEVNGIVASSEWW